MNGPCAAKPVSSVNSRSAPAKRSSAGPALQDGQAPRSCAPRTARRDAPAGIPAAWAGGRRAGRR
jgi:hypothetical protein